MFSISGERSLDLNAHCSDGNFFCVCVREAKGMAVAASDQSVSGKASTVCGTLVMSCLKESNQDELSERFV